MKAPVKYLAEVNVGDLEKKMRPGERVTPSILAERGIIRYKSGKVPPVKLLGSGALTKNLLVKDCQVSGGAKKKIEEAGGKIL